MAAAHDEENGASMIEWSLSEGLRRLVSIVVTAYNQDWVLEQTLESVSAQTYRPLECVIVNDGSTDETAEVISRFVRRRDDNLRIIVIEQENQGAQSARNRGVHATNGEFITFLDGDDLLAPDKSQRQMQFFESAAGASYDVVYGDAKWLVQKGNDFKTGDPVGLGAGDDALISFLEMNRWNPPFVYLSRRKAVEATGPWDTQVRINQDFEYFLRMASKGHHFAYVPGNDGYYRKHVRPRISQAGIQLRARDTLSILTNAERCMQQHRLLTAERQKALSWAYRSVSCWAFQHDRALWKESLAHALRVYPDIEPRNILGRALQSSLGPWRSEWVLGMLRPAKQQLRAAEDRAF